MLTNIYTQRVREREREREHNWVLTGACVHEFLGSVHSPSSYKIQFDAAGLMSCSSDQLPGQDARMWDSRTQRAFCASVEIMYNSSERSKHTKVVEWVFILDTMRQRSNYWQRSLSFQNNEHSYYAHKQWKSIVYMSTEFQFVFVFVFLFVCFVLFF